MLRWIGIETAFHSNCKMNYLQFYGLITSTKEVSRLWQVLWFASMWSFWQNRNAMIFNNKRPTISEVTEEAKFYAWMWLRGKAAGFIYPLPNWLSNLARSLL